MSDIDEQPFFIGVRQHPRVTVHKGIRASLQVEDKPDAPAVCGWMKNISVGGAYLACAGRLPLGAVCAIKFMFQEGGELYRVQATIRIVREDHNGMGVAFRRLPPESLSAIKKLLAKARRIHPPQPADSPN